MNSYSLKLLDPTYTDAMKKNELTTKNAIGDLDTYYLRGGYGFRDPRRVGISYMGKWEISKGYEKNIRAGHPWYYLEHQNSESHPKGSKEDGKPNTGKGLSDFQGSALETSKHSQRALKENEVPNITIVSIPDDYVHYNPTLPRTLSVRECARLQTF